MPRKAPNKPGYFIGKYGQLQEFVQGEVNGKVVASLKAQIAKLEVRPPTAGRLDFLSNLHTRLRLAEDGWDYRNVIGRNTSYKGTNSISRRVTWGLGYSSYKEYLASSHWQETRQRYFRSALAPRNEEGKLCCAFCRRADLPLDLHHRTYERLGRELLKDFVLVCREHHESIHAREMQGMRLDHATRYVKNKSTYKERRAAKKEARKQREREAKQKKREFEEKYGEVIASRARAQRERIANQRPLSMTASAIRRRAKADRVNKRREEIDKAARAARESS